MGSGTARLGGRVFDLEGRSIMLPAPGQDFPPAIETGPRP